MRTSNFTPTATDSIAQVNKPSTTFVNTGLRPGTYYYRLVAVDSAGNRSSTSAQVPANVPLPYWEVVAVHGERLSPSVGPWTWGDTTAASIDGTVQHVSGTIWGAYLLISSYWQAERSYDLSYTASNTGFSANEPGPRIGGAVLRYQDSNNLVGIQGSIDGQGLTFWPYVVVGGDHTAAIPTVLQQQRLAMPSRVDQTIGVRVEARENVYRVYVRGGSVVRDSLVLAFRDEGSHFVASRRVGLMLYPSDYYLRHANQWRNVTARPVPLDLTSPNGGEQWPVGSNQTIRWTSSAGGRVRIEISRDGGSSWSIVASRAQNSGSYNWAVTPPATSNARIRITSTTNSSLSDVSDNSFSITPNLDANNDGRVSVADALFILEIVVGERPSTSRADVNGDGAVTAQDALLVLRNLPSAKWLAVEAGVPIDVRAGQIVSHSSGLREGIIVLGELEDIALGQLVFVYDPEEIAELQVSSASEDFLVFPRQEGDAAGGRLVVDLLRLRRGTGSAGQLRFALRSNAGGMPVLLQVEQSAFVDWGMKIRPQREPLAIKIQQLPRSFALFLNHPNPFNPSTTIRYDLPEAAEVRLAIYNIAGQQVRVLVQEVQEAGIYNAEWDGRDEGGQDAASGVYFYRLQAGSFQAVERMVLVR